MTLTEKYVFLFVDTFCSNFVLSINEELALPVMRQLNDVSYITWLIVVAALTLAGIANYAFGMVIHNIFIRYSTEANKLRYENIKALWLKYYLYFSPLCIMMPLAKVLMFFAGFIKFRFFNTLMILLFWKCVYYATF